MATPEPCADCLNSIAEMVCDDGCDCNCHGGDWDNDDNESFAAGAMLGFGY